MSFPKFKDGPRTVTKRGILRNLARISNPQGFVFSFTLKGTCIYRDV